MKSRSSWEWGIVYCLLTIFSCSLICFGVYALKLKRSYDFKARKQSVWDPNEVISRVRKLANLEDMQDGIVYAAWDSVSLENRSEWSRHIGDLEGLASLVVRLPELTETEVRLLRYQPIKSLCFDGLQEGKQVFSSLRGFDSLQQLVLANCRISEDSTKALADLKQLELIILCRCNARAEQINYLREQLPSTYVLSCDFW